MSVLADGAATPVAPPTQTDRRGTRAVNVAVVAVVPLVATALAWHVVSPLWSPVPTWDQWSMVELFRAHYEGGPVLSLLLEPYQGHLNVLHKGLVYAVGVLTRWDVVWEARLTLGVLGLQTLLLVALVVRTFRRPTLLAPAAAVLTFSFVHYETIVAGYQLGQALSLLCASLSVVCLATGPPTRLRMSVAIGAGVGATFSWAAGVVVWPVGTVVLVARLRQTALRNASFWVWNACGVAAVAGGAWAGSDYHGTLAWANLPGFVTRAVGSPLAPMLVAPGLAPYLGWLGVGALGLFTVLWLRAPDPRLGPWVALGLLSVMNAVVIGLGRSREGVNFALTSRYAHSTYLLWLSVAVVGYGLLENSSALRRGTRSRAVRPVAELVVLALMLYSVWLSVRIYDVVEGWRRSADPVIARLVAGTASDEEIRGYFHPDVALVRTGSDVLRRHGLGAWGQPLSGASPSLGPATMSGATCLDHSRSRCMSPTRR